MNAEACLPNQPLLVIVGPTGSGKTALAIELCGLLHGEILSADSMQIYRGCDIVTAKPSRAEQTLARHHLIDLCEPSEYFSAAQWAEQARAAIEDIRRRYRTPIVAGGTGFYLRALLEPGRLANVPPNEELRAQLQTELEAHGKDVMWQRLQQLDEKAAARLHPNDTFRVLRAIEVASGLQSTLDATGNNTGGTGAQAQLSPVSENQLTPVPQSGYDTVVFGLALPRDQLYDRLEKRVNAMIAAGAWDELQALLAAGVPREAPALGSVGYKQMLMALNGELPCEEAIELWKRDTRRYAKRQMTWFRHQLAVQWVELDEAADAKSIAQEIIRRMPIHHRSAPGSGSEAVR
ncbi:MAG: tRNA dimethylallyltransferase [Abditibacteriota bacterium]|nr:tRNA dimethylallyltransferase [Abditibacteriota bacterium]